MKKIKFIVGTYTHTANLDYIPRDVVRRDGIYTVEALLENGEASITSTMGGIDNPSFVALNAANTRLYAVSEIEEYEGNASGIICAYSVDNDGRLAEINRRLSGGRGPCHIRLNSSESSLVVSNYHGGSVSSFPIEKDGSLGEIASFFQHEGSSINKERQQEAHAHSAIYGSTESVCYVADLGKDKILGYNQDVATGVLTPLASATVDVHPGGGPRHMDWHPSRKYLYGINELDSTVSVYTLGNDHKLECIQSIETLPKDFEGNSTCADIHVHPSGKYVYGSNRGHDSITAFAIDQGTGKLTFIDSFSTLGETPRNFAIVGQGDYLIAANQNTDNIVFFKLNSESGALQATGLEIEVPMPVCLEILSCSW